MSQRRKPISAKLKRSLLKEKRDKKRTQEERQKNAQSGAGKLAAPSGALSDASGDEAEVKHDGEEEAEHSGSGSDDEAPKKSSKKGAGSSAAYLAKKRAARDGASGKSGERRSAAPGNKLSHKMSYDPEKLRTVFAPESKDEVERRKAEARKPVVRVLSRASELGYYSEIIPMPVRPDWDTGMTKDELNSSEESAFQEYLQAIYARYPVARLNYFEHNLEVWRQLWRTCERSDVLVIVADVRHPLFHFPPSLYRYVTRLLGKPMVLVLNKIDMVTRANVNKWVAYLQKHFPLLRIVPFTAHPGEFVTDEKPNPLKKRKPYVKKGGVAAPEPYGAKEVLEACRAAVQESRAARGETKIDMAFESMHVVTKSTDESKSGKSSASESKSQAAVKAKEPKAKKGKSKKPKFGATSGAFAALLDDEDEDAEAEAKDKEESSDEAEDAEEKEEEPEAAEEEASDAGDEGDDDAAEESGSGEAKTEIAEPSGDSKFVTIGVIGHPNAGKSSLINALTGKKVVSVSSTPGHTKYLQTIFLNKSTQLCDCPGLVFPAVDMPRPLQVLAGLFPIAQTREPYSAIQYLAARVPLALIYNLKPSASDDDENEGDEHQWSAWSLCEALARQKSFRTRKGTLDTHRAGNQILQDCCNGVVVLHFEPPSADSAGATAAAGDAKVSEAKAAAVGAGSPASGALARTAMSAWYDEVKADSTSASAAAGKSSTSASAGAAGSAAGDKSGAGAGAKS